MQILEQEHVEPLVELWLREDQIDLIRQSLDHSARQTRGAASDYGIDALCRNVYWSRAQEILKALERGEKKEKP